MGIQNPSRAGECMKFSLPTLLLALIVPLSLPAVGADLFDPEDGMLDMSRYLRDNQYGFFRCLW
jgi:hypothetical protein